MTKDEYNREYHREYSHRYHIANRERILLRCKKYYSEHKEQKKEYAKNHNRKRKRIKSKKERLLKYGLSVDQYNEMVITQKSICKICGSLGPLYVDHNHITNVVRGLLCRHCNWMLGHGKDDPDILLRAAKYLIGAKP
jgi:recombination endonuclease VII